jgi:hypothetical protein
VNASIAAASPTDTSHLGPSNRVAGLNRAPAAVVVHVTVDEPVVEPEFNTIDVGLDVQTGGNVCVIEDETLADTAIVAVKPPVPVALIVTLADCPGAEAVNDDALGAKVNEPGVVTVTVTGAVTITLPLVPFTVTV